MIAVMANHLGYYVYDLELTAMKDHTELKKLLIATSSRAVIVIEDIDCSRIENHCFHGQLCGEVGSSVDKERVDG
ncbi:hypothetical protein SASPL_113788 [Salvia splendens]|uniref:Uncharacterized protein n=1 Tax=Salvia splendens TaxID=180675 RepID=A0A8X8Y4P8_SALSN|nr:hypothetical protein SASPL_113788 [Salvia splendens]